MAKRDELAFLEGSVTHRRHGPTSNTFTYPTCCLRVPLARLGELASNGVAWNARGWLSFHDRDHGPCDGTSLDAWMRALLAQYRIDGVEDITLYAFPRVLGYAFKPVSFWVCHSREHEVRAVLAEVSNTFGERHCYLLANPDGAVLRSGATLQAPKVFHVSPFCEVRGHYRFRFHFGRDKWLARIDYFDDDQASSPLLETWIQGNAVALSRAATRRVLWRYGWASALVIIRIHRQALNLWRKRVRWFSKPAPPPDPVSRGSTANLRIR